MVVQMICNFFHCVGAKCSQQVNICSFVVRCDRMWPSTRWHRIYTGSDNVPYVQSESVDDFISEPRCLKFAVGLQMRGRKMGVQEVWSDSGPKGREWRELLRALSIGTYALCSFRMSKAIREWVGMIHVLSIRIVRIIPFLERAHPLL